MSSRLLIALLLLAITQLSLAQVEVITTKHVPANELVAKIKPFLDQHAVITADGFNILLKANEQDIETVHELVTKLDVPSKQFQIEVKTNVSPARAKWLLSVKNKPQVYSTQSQTEKNYSLKVSLGRAAFIQTGQHVPQLVAGYQNSDTSSTIITTPDSTLTNNQNISDQGARLAYKELKSGFDITITSSTNGMVGLDVRQQDQALESNTHINQQAQATSLNIPIGQWIRLGSVNTDNEREYHTMISIGGERSHQAYSTLIRVIELD